MAEVLEPFNVDEREKVCVQNPRVGGPHVLVRGVGKADDRYWVCVWGCGLARKRTGEPLPEASGPGGPEQDGKP